MMPTSLDSWLSYIESQHLTEIDLGLERGSYVLAKLNIARPKGKIITVAGTNGKGSTCSMLTQYLHSQSHTVGTYTSPHLLAFNERIAINGTPCDDKLICQAFETIDAIREATSLTYFEFSTLAALWIFSQSELDDWVLEVGLGGRLDAVNMVDTDVAVVTSIALDHTDWLGDSIESIAREKTGIARKDKLLVSGVVNPPGSLAETAAMIGADLRQKGEHFSFAVKDNQWCWSGDGRFFNHLPLPNLPIENAATVIAVLSYMGLGPTQEALVSLFTTAQLMGRFQKVSNAPLVYIDVAHNPEAAGELASRLSAFEKKPIAVCGMLKDKDINSVILRLMDSFSFWCFADLGDPRGAKAQNLVKILANNSQQNSDNYLSVEVAFDAALVRAMYEGRSIIVFGSFVTVTDYLTYFKHQEAPC